MVLTPPHVRLWLRFRYHMSHTHDARSPPAAKLASYVTEIDRYAPIGPSQSASTPEEPDPKLLLGRTSWPYPKPT